jgi:hypothetical protein
MSSATVRFYTVHVHIEDSYSLQKMLTWRGPRGQLTEGIKQLRAAIRQELRSRKAA